jgi:hypothetical protein
MRIPSNHGPGYIPVDSGKNFLHNIPIVVRECQANATTYGAQNAHAVRVVFAEDEAMFVYMHDGRPFDDLHDIMTKGLTPNESGGQGWAYQGNGLTYCAAYLNNDQPRLVIASRTPNGFAAATATPDFAVSNEWRIEDQTEFWKDRLYSVIGERIVEKFNVFYLFRIPTPQDEDDMYKEEAEEAEVVEV